MRILKFFTISLLFISTNASAIEVQSIINKICTETSQKFITKQDVFDDKEADDEEKKSGKYRVQVTFISNGFHYTILYYDSFKDNDDFLVIYKPENSKKSDYSSIFDIDDVTGQIINIIETNGEKFVYEYYNESPRNKQKAEKIVENHMRNIRNFLKLGLLKRQKPSKEGF